MSSQSKHRLNRILLWVLIIIMAVWMLFPFYWAFNSSFKTENQLQMTPTTFVPRNVQGELEFYNAQLRSCFYEPVIPARHCQ